MRSSHLFLLTLCSATALAQTCSPTQTCAQGCCSTSGNCGFGPAYCGQGNCTSNCDAQAECGQYAPAGKQSCPLNVCCSRFGFCGTTSDFCGTGCQNGCEAVAQPSCFGASSSKRTIAYYESWASKRTCDPWTPERIDANAYTHINFAFATINRDNHIAPMNSYDAELYPRVTALKDRNRALKVFISVGGWAVGGEPFSRMIATPASRQSFILSAVQFMRSYGFDGIDIDWEYPAAADRQGRPEDTQNFVTFLKELRAGVGNAGVTVTLPLSYWYLQGFDLVGMTPHVDWFNLMSYDIHGTWDGNSPFTKAVVQPHTNLTEITDGLSLLWRNKVPPSKVVLGLAYYGRSFTLKDSACSSPGCAFSSGGTPGMCTGESGILSNAEIDRVIKQNNLTPTLDRTAGVKYITWAGNQWVSYDDAETLSIKRQYADGHCLGGLMIWALDLADPSNDQSILNLKAAAMARADGPQAFRAKAYAALKYDAVQKQNNAQLSVVWTACRDNGGQCPPGMKVLTQAYGRVGERLTNKGQSGADVACHARISSKDDARNLCITNDVEASGCGWYGTGKSCSQGCPRNMILVARNSAPTGSYTTCDAGRYASFCCSSITAANSGLCDSEGNTVTSGSLGTLINFGLGTMFQCKPRVEPRGLGGWHGEVAYKAYIEQEVPGSFADAGGLAYYNPTYNQPYPIDDIGLPCQAYQTVTAVDTWTTGPITTATCDYRQFGQACQHYKSVDNIPYMTNVHTCPFVKQAARPAVDEYNRQHKRAWNSWISLAPPPRAPGYKCDRDEWPALHFLGPPGGHLQYIRRVPKGDNERAGMLWQYACQRSTATDTSLSIDRNGACYIFESITTTLPRFSMAFTNMPADPEQGVLTNWCQLTSTMSYDPGFALMTQDPWYGRNQQHSPWDYNSVRIPEPLTRNKVAPRQGENYAKRNALIFEDFLVDNGNSTELKSAEELMEAYGVTICESENCKEELRAAGVPSLDAVRSAEAMPTLGQGIRIRGQGAIPATAAPALSKPLGPSPIETARVAVDPKT